MFCRSFVRRYIYCSSLNNIKIRDLMSLNTIKVGQKPRLSKRGGVEEKRRRLKKYLTVAVHKLITRRIKTQQGQNIWWGQETKNCTELSSVNWFCAKNIFRMRLGKPATTTYPTVYSGFNEKKPTERKYTWQDKFHLKAGN